MLNKKIIIKIAAVIILLSGLIFFNNSGPISYGKDLIIKVLNPLAQGTAAINRLVGVIKGDDPEKAIDDKLNLIELKHENDRLLTENRDFRNVLNFKEKSGINLKGADVILYAKEQGHEFILINQGANQGISKGDFVIDSNNLLVGAIKEAEMNFAKVVIASNPDYTISAKLGNTGMSAVAKGLGARTFSIEFISGDSSLRAGDFVYLSDPSAPANNFLTASIINELVPKNVGLREARATLVARPDLLKHVFIVINQ